jgi:integrase
MIWYLHRQKWMPQDAGKEITMRKRYQRGCLRKVNRRWIAQWWQDGHHRKRTLGLASKMTKSQARLELEAILAPVNACQTPSTRWSFGDFVQQIHLPFYKRKWKGSTAVTTEHRIKLHLIAEFRERTLNSFTRDELQDLLERKAASGLSFSTVDHLRWDLKQIFEMAMADGYLSTTPAALLFTPQEAGSLPRRRMNWKEVALCLSVLDTREQVITMLSVLAGMRPGEILALWWQPLLSG